MRIKYLLLFFYIMSTISSFAQVHDVQKGDILVINGIKGIVFKVNDEGTHGQMMSVKAFRAKSDLFTRSSSHLRKLSMQSESNGKANTEELFTYATATNSLGNYPVFKWCKSLGDGWYIPSIEQLKEFVNYWVGNTDVEVDWDEDDDSTTTSAKDGVVHTKKVNNILLKAGGIPFLNGVFTSTLSKDKKVDVFNYSKDDGKWTFKKMSPMKIDSYSVGRAFFDF